MHSQAAMVSDTTSFPKCHRSEFVIQAVRDWIAAVSAKTTYVETGNPYENG